MLIGLLALQGDYDAHQRVLQTLGAQVRLVRAPCDLKDLDGLVIPGGESTVMHRLCDRYELRRPLEALVDEAFPMLGTCAGLIFLAKTLEGTSENFTQTGLGALDVRVARNAYGAQLDSFETDLEVPTLGETIRAVFIRAPQIREIAADVEVLATHQNIPVLVRQNNVMASSFHPEIAGETRVHELWLKLVAARQTASSTKPAAETSQ